MAKHTQTNCLNAFDYFLGLALKGLTEIQREDFKDYAVLRRRGIYMIQTPDLFPLKYFEYLVIKYKCHYQQ